MPLSEYEQRVLEQMERQLGADDPKLAGSFETGVKRRAGRYVLGGFGVVLGIALLIAGVSSSIPVIGVLGFVVMLLGVIFSLSAPKKQPKAGQAPTPTPMGPTSSQSKTDGATGSFMNRLEDRWDKRRRERGL